VYYEWQGKRYEFEGDAVRRYIAEDLVDHGSGMWYPTGGTEESYRYGANYPTFDADWVVDNLLKDGKLVVRENLTLSTRREWRVIKLEAINPAMNLWFDPPDGVAVRSTETGDIQIAGMTKEESDRTMGFGAKTPPLASVGRRLLIVGVFAAITIALAAWAMRKLLKKTAS
jgi:hypothetical protein